jgi:thioredoxin 2
MRFAKLDTEQEPALAARFAIRSIPTLLVFAGGKLLAQRNGSLPASVFKMWLQSVLEQQVTK